MYYSYLKHNFFFSPTLFVNCMSCTKFIQKCYRCKKLMTLQNLSSYFCIALFTSSSQFVEFRTISVEMWSLLENSNWNSNAYLKKKIRQDLILNLILNEYKTLIVTFTIETKNTCRAELSQSFLLNYYNKSAVPIGRACGTLHKDYSKKNLTMIMNRVHLRKFTYIQ